MALPLHLGSIDEYDHYFPGYGSSTLVVYDFRHFFFYFWIIIASTYPTTVLIGNDSIAFQLKGSDQIQTFKYDELEFSSKKGYYEFAVAGTKRRKKFWISTKDIPAELEKYLQNKFIL